MKFGRIVMFVLGAPFLTAGALASGQKPSEVLGTSWKWAKDGDQEVAAREAQDQREKEQ